MMTSQDFGDARALEEIYVEAIRGLGPTFDDLRRQPTFKIPREDEGRTVEVIASTRLHRDVAADIFTHDSNSDPGTEFWAKGLVVVNFTTKRYEALFWQTGIGRDTVNVHHRDALRFANLILLNERKRRTEYLKTMSTILPDEWPSEELAHFNVELIKLVSEADAEDAEHANMLGTVRTQSSFGECDLRLTTGFQLAAKREASGLQITGMDLDSSLTSAWLSQNIRVKPPVMAQMIVFAVSAIDPRLRAFRHIGIRLPEPEVRYLNGLLVPLWELLDSDLTIELKHTHG